MGVLEEECRIIVENTSKMNLRDDLLHSPLKNLSELGLKNASLKKSIFLNKFSSARTVDTI